jgi:hypothetical protein
MTSWTNTVLYGLINYINSRPNPLYRTIFGVHCKLTQKDLTLITISRPQEQSENTRKGSDNDKGPDPEPICFTLMGKVHSVVSSDTVVPGTLLTFKLDHRHIGPYTTDIQPKNPPDPGAGYYLGATDCQGGHRGECGGWL